MPMSVPLRFVSGRLWSCLVWCVAECAGVRRGVCAYSWWLSLPRKWQLLPEIVGS